MPTKLQKRNDTDIQYFHKSSHFIPFFIISQNQKCTVSKIIVYLWLRRKATGKATGRRRNVGNGRALLGNGYYRSEKIAKNLLFRSLNRIFAIEKTNKQTLYEETFLIYIIASPSFAG